MAVCLSFQGESIGLVVRQCDTCHGASPSEPRRRARTLTMVGMNGLARIKRRCAKTPTRAHRESGIVAWTTLGKNKCALECADQKT